MNRDPEIVLEFPYPVLVFDSQMDILGASREAFKAFNVPFRRSELSVSLATLQERFMAADGPGSLVTERSLSMTAPGATERVDWRTEDEHHYVLTVFYLEDELGGMYGLLVQDLTSANRLHDGLEKAREHMVEILNSLPVGITVMDTELVTTSINQTQLAFLRELNKDLDLIATIGHRLSSFMQNCGEIDWRELEEWFLQSDEERHRFEFELEIDDRKRFFSGLLVRLRDSRAEVVGNIFIAEDVTERREIEQQLREAELASTKMETLRAVDVTLKHEIHNALTPIMLNCEIMEELINENAKPFLAEVACNTERIQSVVEKIGAISDVETACYLRDTLMLDLQGSPKKSEE